MNTDKFTLLKSKDILIRSCNRQNIFDTITRKKYYLRNEKSCHSLQFWRCQKPQEQDWFGRPVPPNLAVKNIFSEYIKLMVKLT